MSQDMSLRWYLAGPMSNIPQFNFPLFERATVSLRDMGYNIVSPHEQDSEAVQVAAWASPDGKLVGGEIAGETWPQILARDVVLVGDKVDGIIFLPNWWQSRGAKLEAFVGLLTNKQFRYFSEKGEYSIDRGEYVTQDTVEDFDVKDVRESLRRWMP